MVKHHASSSTEVWMPNKHAKQMTRILEPSHFSKDSWIDHDSLWWVKLEKVGKHQKVIMRSYPSAKSQIGHVLQQMFHTKTWSESLHTHRLLLCILSEEAVPCFQKAWQHPSDGTPPPPTTETATVTTIAIAINHQPSKHGPMIIHGNHPWKRWMKVQSLMQTYPIIRLITYHIDRW